MTNEGLGGWPARRALMTPERTAIIYQDKATTYGEFFTRATKVASRLRADGIEKGDRVGYLGPNHPAFVETMFAAHMLGAIFVPLNFRLATPELEYMISDAGIKILVRDPATAEVTGTKIISLDDYEAWLAAGSADPIDAPVAQDEIAFILYTSGTTGRPKGAMLSHANQIWNSYNVLVAFDVAGDEVSLIAAPLFHVAALGQLLLPTFLKGGCSVLTPTWDVDAAFDLIERYRITWIFGVTTMFASLVQSSRWAEADLSSVRSPDVRWRTDPGVVDRGVPGTRTGVPARLWAHRDLARRDPARGQPEYPQGRIRWCAGVLRIDQGRGADRATRRGADQRTARHAGLLEQPRGDQRGLR